jgi:hypothetical protein
MAIIITKPVTTDFGVVNNAVTYVRVVPVLELSGKRVQISTYCYASKDAYEAGIQPFYGAGIPGNPNSDYNRETDGEDILAFALARTKIAILENHPEWIDEDVIIEL